MNILVLGGSGFLGSHVVDALLAAGHKVTLFDRISSPFPSSAQLRVGDLLDAASVEDAIQGQDIVYHFAGLADLDDATTKPLETIKLNIEGTLNVLQACVKAKVSRLMYASTIYVYSNKGGFYRCSKQAAELYIEEFNREFGLSYTVLRYGTLYGPRADDRNSIYRYLKEAICSQKISVSGSGEELREYIHVRDAAKLSVEALDVQYKNRHLTLTGHHPLQLKHLLATINEILENKIKVEFLNSSHSTHYTMTPYTYIPKLGLKLTSNAYTDIGQGLIECLEEIHTP